MMGNNSANGCCAPPTRTCHEPAPRPNPNRNHPLYCPYCASENLFPDVETEFAWNCRECLRVFAVMFYGQNDPGQRPKASLSTADALKASLNHDLYQPH